MSTKREIEKTEADWEKELTPEQYRIMREKGTERAFTGAYVDNHDKGMYRCAACHEPLFDSDTKYDSGSGWPSFFKPLDNAVETQTDRSLFMSRVAIVRMRSSLPHSPSAISSR